MVNEEKQIWHCFGCNKGGDAFAFLMEIEGVEFKEALKILAERTGVELPRYSKGEKPEHSNRVFEILELATKFYEKQLHDGMGKKKALPYVHERGLSEESIRNFRLGYAPDGWRNIMDFLASRGYGAEEIEKSGLVIRKENGSGYYDRFRDRIMFPIMDVLGRVIGYSARVTPGSDESQAKYINTPETGIYRKSRVLYGIQRAKQSMKQRDFALLVEGNMDVIAAHQAGITNTIAVSGTALTPEQLTLIQRYTDNVRMFFDMDGAGQAAARRSTEIALAQGMNVSIIAVEDGKDAADIVKNNPDILRKAVEKPLSALEYFLQRQLSLYDHHSPEGKRKIAHDYLNLIRFVAHEIDRAYWMKRLSQALEVEERMLLDVFQKAAPRGNDESKGISGDVSKSSPRVATHPFEKRSDFLRNTLYALMLSDAQTWREMVSEPNDSIIEFLKQDPFYGILQDKGAQAHFVFDAFFALLSEDEWKQEAIRLSFEGGKMFEGMSFVDEAQRSEWCKRSVQRYVADLRKELRKESMIRLEAAMRAAQEKGDKERERSLKEEFNTLMSTL